MAEKWGSIPMNGAQISEGLQGIDEAKCFQRKVAE
jgi:hypothetical protein